MSDRDRAYRILGLETDATLKEIQEAYQDLKAVWHPDRFADNPELKAKAEEKQEAVESAYQLLLDDHTSRKQEPKTTAPSVPQNGEQGRGPSILDDTLSERKGASKKWLPVWYVLFGIVAVGVVISFLTWSPVDVETDSELSEAEKIVAEAQAVRSEEQEPEDESASEEFENGETYSEPKVGGTQEENLPKGQETLSPGKASQVVAAPPVEQRSEPTQTRPSKPKVAASVPQSPASPQAEESEPAPEEVAQEEAVPEEQGRSELAERAFQILRAKSELANRLVEGDFPDYGFRDWKVLERSATEVYVDLLADSVSDGREVHFVWSVDVEAQSVRAMSQAARDLKAGDR